MEELANDAQTALREVASWLENHVSRPHPALGRSGEVCPWTRRTIDLGKLLLTPVPSDDAAVVDAIVLTLLRRFLKLEPTKGVDASFRSMIGVFHRLDPEKAASFLVATHTRLKPAFLERGLMLGEFFPTNDKPGLRNPSFKALRSPIPLLVVRMMVEADVEFLLDRDEFVEAYLRTHRSRGLERLMRVLAVGPQSLTPERIAHLSSRVEQYRAYLTATGSIPPTAPESL